MNGAEQPPPPTTTTKTIKYAQATSILNGDNPTMDTVRGFENLGLGFNLIDGQRTRNLMKFTLSDGNVPDGGSLENLNKEDFFHDVVTDPGTAEPEDCHEFDTFKVIGLACVCLQSRPLWSEFSYQIRRTHKTENDALLSAARIVYVQ